MELLLDNNTNAVDNSMKLFLTLDYDDEELYNYGVSGSSPLPSSSPQPIMLSPSSSSMMTISNNNNQCLTSYPVTQSCSNGYYQFHQHHHQQTEIDSKHLEWIWHAGQLIHVNNGRKKKQREYDGMVFLMKTAD
jgi:hypothetical protein